MRSADVVVIGGGPAGATAARLLALWGRRVVLLTRPAPRPALAESLPPSCAKLFDRLGIRQAVDAAGFVRSTGNTVRWGASDERVELFGGGVLGYQVARDVLNELLLDEAAGEGAVVNRRATVREVKFTGRAGSTARVTYESGGARRHLVARWILDCSGRSGVLARHEARRAEPAGRTMAIVGIWERPDRWAMADDTHTLVESYAGGWAWSVPVSATRRYVTMMVDPALTAVRGRARLAATYRAELACTEGLAVLVEGATLAARPFARDASSYSVERAGRDGLLLVGDAASAANPLSSFGVKKALASAWLAAIVVNSCLRNTSLSEPALALFAARERAMYESLRYRYVMFSRDAAQAHAAGFWSERADVDDHGLDGEPDVTVLRTDPDVLGALEELKRRPALALRQAPDVRRVPKAVVRGNLVALEEHLVAPAFREGVRYVRNVDLVTLADLASAHAQVPDLFDAYNRAAPPAPLPDFLGALAVLVGKRVLAFA